MRVRLIELWRNFFHRPDLPYTLYIKVQGTENELKELQRRIVDIVNGGEFE